MDDFSFDKHHETHSNPTFISSVVLCEHTNTERGYLKAKLQPKLQLLLNESTNAVEDGAPNPIEVIVSELDEDPLKIV